jgi:hypothetical protein
MQTSLLIGQHRSVPERVDGQCVGDSTRRREPMVMALGRIDPSKPPAVVVTPICVQAVTKTETTTELSTKIS